jgi:hypothetical protein
MRLRWPAGSRFHAEKFLLRLFLLTFAAIGAAARPYLSAKRGDYTHTKRNIQDQKSRNPDALVLRHPGVSTQQFGCAGERNGTPYAFEGGPMLDINCPKQIPVSSVRNTIPKLPRLRTMDVAAKL